MILFETKNALVEVLVKQPGANVCTLRCTVKLVTSSQDNDSAVQQLSEETEEFRMWRVSSWMVTQQVESNENLTYFSNSCQHFNFQP